jgi:hypothetical protein
MLSPKIHIICIGVQCILKLGILGLKSMDLGILGLKSTDLGILGLKSTDLGIL